MRVYRLCRKRFVALDGEGARLYGGRWNSPGRSVVYASATLSLAALEYLIHVDPSDAPADLVSIEVGIPDDLAIQTADVANLPGDWHATVGSAACRRLGDAWLERGATPVLRVPAAPVPTEWNILINPNHPAASRVTVVSQRPFAFDPRLLT